MGPSSVHDEPHEFFVVYVSLWVFLTEEDLLDFFIG